MSLITSKFDGVPHCYLKILKLVPLERHHNLLLKIKSPMSNRSILIEMWQEGIVSIDYEALLERHYRKIIKSGDSVIDVGAHNGRHAHIFLELVGQDGNLVLFEPLEDKAAALKNAFPDNTIVHQKALSNFTGTADFVVAHGSLEESGLKGREYNNPELVKPSVAKVQVDMLDTFIKDVEGLSFIKVDGEGAEIDALSGADNLIATYRPSISVEYGSLGYEAYGHTSETLFQFATDHDMIVYDMFLNELVDGLAWSKAVNSIYWDFLLVPVEKKEEITARLQAADA